MKRTINILSKNEWIIWIVSLVILTISNIAFGDVDLLTLTATWIGITSLIFAAKGNVFSQVLMIIFSILYGIISWRFRYWGEMITYLGMTMPMAIWSTITWLKNPSQTNGNEVKIQKIKRKHIASLLLFCILITIGFYFLLKKLDTPNIIFSTLSIMTSFLAAALTMLRSSYYALGFAANVVVLIVLWSLASTENPGYISVVFNFVIFLFFDMYGFVSWKKREIKQNQEITF